MRDFWDDIGTGDAIERPERKTNAAAGRNSVKNEGKNGSNVHLAIKTRAAERAS